MLKKFIFIFFLIGLSMFIFGLSTYLIFFYNPQHHVAEKFVCESNEIVSEVGEVRHYISSKKDTLELSENTFQSKYYITADKGYYEIFLVQDKTNKWKVIDYKITALSEEEYNQIYKEFKKRWNGEDD